MTGGASQGFQKDADTARAAERTEKVGRGREGTAEFEQTRLIELVELSDRLKDVNRFDLGKLFGGAGQLLLGGALGASVTPEASLGDKWVFVALVSGAICLAARLALHQRQADSVHSIKKSLDVMLATYQDPELLEAIRELYANAGKDPSLIVRCLAWIKEFRAKESVHEQVL